MKTLREIKHNTSFKERRSIIGTIHGRTKLDIYKTKFWDPHEEMRAAYDAYNYNSLFQAAVNSLVRFIIGNDMKIICKDELTQKFLQSHVDNSDMENVMTEVVENTIKSGNGYLEIDYNPTTGLPHKYYPVADSSRIYINANQYGEPFTKKLPDGNIATNKHEFYLQEVDYTYWGTDAAWYEISYVFGTRFYNRRIRAIPIPKSKFIHFRLNLGDTGIYGRSYIASALNDDETLREIERSLAIIAKYKAIPRKIIQYGGEGGPNGAPPADEDEKDDLINYIETLEPEENIVVNKPIKAEDWSYSGSDVNMDYMINHTRKKIIAGLAPEFLLGLGDETNRATAKEQLVAFLLAVMSLRKKFIKPLRKDVFDKIIEYNVQRGFKLSQDYNIEFGELDFETRLEKVQRVGQMWTTNEITFNEMREELGLTSIDKEGDKYFLEWQQKMMPQMDMMGGGFPSEFGEEQPVEAPEQLTNHKPELKSGDKITQKEPPFIKDAPVSEARKIDVGDIIWVKNTDQKLKESSPWKRGKVIKQRDDKYFIKSDDGQFYEEIGDNIINDHKSIKEYLTNLKEVTQGQMDSVLREIADIAKKNDIRMLVSGGLVRNELAKLPFDPESDADLTTENRGDSIALAYLVADAKHLPTPEIYKGSGVAYMKIGGIDVEFRGLRKDLDYVYNDLEARGKDVNPLNEDAYSRDFTMNAVFKDISTGEYIDPTEHGKLDANKRIVRTPIHPEVLIKRRPALILRALRFKLQLNGTINDELEIAIHKYAPLLRLVGRKEYKHVMPKLLKQEGAMQELQEYGLLNYIPRDVLKGFKEKLTVIGTGDSDEDTSDVFPPKSKKFDEPLEKEIFNKPLNLKKESLKEKLTAIKTNEEPNIVNLKCNEGCCSSPNFQEKATDAPHYRLGKDYSEWCKVCHWYDDKKEFCNKYRFEAEPDYTCDSFIPESNLERFNEKLNSAKKEFPKNPSGTKYIDQKFGIELRKVFNSAKMRLLTNLAEYKETYNNHIRTEATIHRGFMTLLLGTMSALNPKLRKIIETYIGMSMMKGYRDSMLSVGIKGVRPPEKEIVKSHVNRAMHHIKGFTEKMEDDLREMLSEGISQGDSVSTIAGLIRDKFKITESRSRLISRTEVVRTYNFSKLETMRASGKKFGRIIASWDDRTCKGHNFDAYNAYDGKTYHNCREWRNKIVRLDNPLLPVTDSHPNCFVEYGIPIYTINGWKKIGNIKVNDKVLTHKGKFKKVTKLLENKKYKGKVIKLFYSWANQKTKPRTQSLTMTPEHPVLTSDGWKKAENLTKYDRLIFLAKECKGCGELFPHFNIYDNTEFCTLTCFNRYSAKIQWQNPKNREIVSKKVSEWNKKRYEENPQLKYDITKEANKVTRQKVAEGTQAFQKWYKSDNYVNPMNFQESRDKIGVANSKEKNGMWKRKQNRSKYEDKFAELMNGFNIEYEWTKLIPSTNKQGMYRIDFYIPKYNLLVEIDNEYQLKNKEYDKQREQYLQSLGYNIIRIYNEQIDIICDLLKGKNNISDFMELIKHSKIAVMNHKGLYQYMEIDIDNIQTKEMNATKKLYNFAVEDDESYIAKGMVVHNCRCSLISAKEELTGELK